jgi:hypothetical protein
VVSGLTRLANPEAGQRLNVHRTFLDGRHLCERRPLLQPGVKRIQRRVRTAGEYLNITVVKVDCMACDTEPLRLAPCAVAKPDALYTPSDAEAPRWRLRIR